MSDNRSPDDAGLQWPVTRGELDDIETLELGPDAAGRLAWQNMAPPGPDTYQAWMPRRGRGATSQPLDDTLAVGGDDPMALFASEATSRPTRPLVQPLEVLAPLAIDDRIAPSSPPLPASSAEPLPELALRDAAVTTVVAAAPSTEPRTVSDQPAPPPWIPLPLPRPSTPSRTGQATISGPGAQDARASTKAWSAEGVPSQRLSIASTPAEERRAVRISWPPRTAHARIMIERLALLAAGALIGVVASTLFRVAGTPQSPPDGGKRAASTAAGRPSPGPFAAALVPLATPVVPNSPLSTAAFTSPTVVTDIAPVTPPPPTHVTAPASAPTRAAAPAPAPQRATGVATETATGPAAAPAPIPTPPEALATVGRFAAAYNRMDANATQAVWPAADREALVTTFSALREQRLTLSRCRGTMEGATATVMCRGTLRYRPRVGNHDTRSVEGTWRFSLLQRADEWVVDGVESP